MITCGGCDATWTGLNVAHCAACHETFSTARLFDEHRSADGEHGSCLRPEDRPGMFFRRGMWRGPEWTAREIEILGGDT
jgi:hypothetical protein